MIVFDDYGGSMKLPLRAERFWIVGCSIRKRLKRKVKTKGYIGELGSEMIMTTVPWQRRQKCLSEFLSISRRNPQAHGYTIVALHSKVFRVSYFPKGTDV